MNKRNDITELSNEVTYHRYLINQKQISDLFKDISIAEYIAMQNISKSAVADNNSSGRTYLQDIAGRLEISIPQTSEMIGRLRDRGLVLWGHDGNGSEGTYVTITESGIKLMNQQENVLKGYYSRIIEKFGEDNLLSLLQLMKQLESVIDSELSNKGE